MIFGLGCSMIVITEFYILPIPMFGVKITFPTVDSSVDKY